MPEANKWDQKDYEFAVRAHARWKEILRRSYTEDIRSICKQQIEFYEQRYPQLKGETQDADPS